ncbi:MAG: GNAT family N-acetyltransferase [Patescibacteria group bacterium]|jgi:ribosomal-protein-alanine N-acetyltransferase
MQTRFYKNEDYESVKSILSEADMFDEVWDSKQHLAKKIQLEAKGILLAVENKEIIGCIYVNRNPWACFLYRLAVRKQYRKKGAGTLLIETATNMLQEEGVEEVAIYVDSSNEDLQNFYEKRGFIKGGLYRCMYKKLDGEDE